MESQVSKSPLEMSFSRGEPAFRTFALLDPDNIIGISTNALGFDMAEIMSFYNMIVQVEAHDFDQYHLAAARRPKIATWERFWKFVFTEPVILMIAILAVVHYKIDTLSFRSRERDLFQIWRIERLLIRSINDALCDPLRSVSDQMLIAVMLIAAYEIKHGKPECYHIHMRGLVQMVALRGGLSEIAKQDAYVERLLLFQDAKTAKLAGSEGYLKTMASSLGHRLQDPPDHMNAIGPRVLKIMGANDFAGA